MSTVNIRINGRVVTATVEPRMQLADFLRDKELLTGTHLGCEHGVCGTCTLLIDGAPARSCIAYAVACDGAEITTIEGLDDDEVASQLRTAFSREHALQCGFCTPGMLITARDIVIRLPDADEKRIRTELSGNLCRCTGYVGIVRAISGVLEERRRAGHTAFPPIPTRLGPVGAARAAPSTTSRRNALASAPPPRAPAPSPADIVGMAGGGVIIRESFTVEHAPTRVWAAFQQIDRVAHCMPGAVLTEAPRDGRVRGRIRIKLGPIGADFAGEAEIESDPAGYRGIIRGRGRDARGGSSARGEVRYVLSEERGGGATRVDLEIAYGLTGALAQFSRGGIVQDLARRLTTTFAANLQAALDRDTDGGAAAPNGLLPTTELDAGSLVLAALWSRLKALFDRFFRIKRR